MSWIHSSTGAFTLQCDTCGKEFFAAVRNTYGGLCMASKEGWEIIEDEDGKTHTCPACCKARELVGQSQDASQDWKDYARIKRDLGPLTAFLFAEAVGLVGESVTGLSAQNKHSIPEGNTN